MKGNSKNMILRSFFKENKWEVAGFLLLVFSVLINIFPEGHIILGGDVVQVFDLSENFKHYYSEDWFRQAILFYGIFYFLDKIGVSDTMQISWYLGIFLIGSYLSFLAFCRLILPSLSGLARTLGSLFYATNVYTLYIFTATWGYISYQSLYIFIPVLTGLYIKALTTKKNAYLFWFLLVLFFASMGFSNPAFALSLGIFFFFATILLFLCRLARFDLDILKRVAVIGVGAILINSYWILPLIPQLRGGIQEVYTSEFVDLSERLKKTSNAIFDTVRLLPTSEQERYFPENFPYPQVSWMEQYIFFLTFIPFFIVLIGFMRKKSEENERQLFALFFALFLIFIGLVARVHFPFDTVNSFLFHLPGLNTLRGYDKTATFVPFILAVLLALSLVIQQRSKYYKVFFAGFFILIILSSLPFYAGGLQTKLSYILSHQKAKDFSEAKQSALVKIPEPYFAVAPLLRADQENNKVSMLPFSPGSSVGRVSFPEWKVNGPYVVKDLYGKKYVELYGYYIPGWMFAREFENKIYDPRWIADLYGLLGVKYVFYHKDAKERSIEEMEDARRYLEKIGVLEKIDDNESFYLYTIDEKLVFPYLYFGTNIHPVDMSPEKLSEHIALLRERITPISYEQKGLQRIAVKTEGMKRGSKIFLNEAASSFWRAKYISSDGRVTPLRKDATILYANAWVADNDLKEGSIEIYFLPAHLLGYGQWTAGITFFLVVVGLIWAMRKKRRSVVKS